MAAVALHAQIPQCSGEEGGGSRAVAGAQRSGTTSHFVPLSSDGDGQRSSVVFEPPPAPLGESIVISRDQNSIGIDQNIRSEIDVVQLSLNVLGTPPRIVRDKPTRRQAVPIGPSMELFAQRLQASGSSLETQKAFVWRVRHTLSAAHRLGFPATSNIVALFQDRAMLGRALVDDHSYHVNRLSKSTLAQRRSAVRAFARHLAPELRPIVGSDPVLVVETALREVSQRVGSVYRSDVGAPRRRGGYVPSSEEVSFVLGQVAKAPRHFGLRNEVFFKLLYETGSRVNALRQLDCRDVFVMPGGRIRMQLHAKGQRTKREVELSNETAKLLLAYVDEFNAQATFAGGGPLIRVGQQGWLWRGKPWASRWSYNTVLSTLSDAVLAVGAHAFSPHALRRAFASEAASTLPRQVVAQAGGWRGRERMDDHYIQPRNRTILQKLAASGQWAMSEVTDGTGVPNQNRRVGQAREAARSQVRQGVRTRAAPI